MECQSLSYRTRVPNYGTLLEEFPKGNGDTVNDEHSVSSAEKWSVGGDHTDFRGHAASMRPRS